MGELVLLTSCSVMFLGSYAAGCVPLYFSLNKRKIRLATIFGAGLLIGTSFSIIIPEGISALYDSAALASINVVKNEKTLDNYKLVKLQAQQSYSLSKQNVSWTQLLPNLQEQLQQKQSSKSLLKSSRKKQYSNFDKAIGLVLTTGFLFMFVVDQFSKAQTVGRNNSVSTIGLVIHAAADGIAMGSTLAVSETETQMIVFLATMIHKSPAAFALVSFLLMEGLEKYRVRKHLLVFSLAAPLSTIFMFIFLRNIETQSVFSTTYCTGLIILFSSGTFLYIAATHILPELIESKDSIVPALTRSSHFSLLEVFLFMLSAMLPSIVALHHHSHQ